MNYRYSINITAKDRVAFEELLQFKLLDHMDSEIHPEGKYYLDDHTLVTEDELVDIIYQMPVIRRTYPLQGELSLLVEIGVEPDNAIPYLNPSLYLGDQLVAHHVAIHELEEFEAGLVFDLEQGEHLFKVSEYGEHLLDIHTYTVTLNKKE